ncbi:MAG TPA: hypothetical protein PKL77_02505 [Candidatus Omnitrophota bacterium]|nr:hypothetical protein [Candidatus Omnitrophota bacterium]HPT07031.1 hypothetical protein [Candidatus Omnitrophota bacterium]
MHEKKSFWQRLMYTYELVGTVERDGQIFKKYKKIPRYPALKSIAIVFMYMCVLGAVFVFFNFLWNLTQSKKDVPPQQQTRASILQQYFV